MLLYIDRTCSHNCKRENCVHYVLQIYHEYSVLVAGKDEKDIPLTLLRFSVIKIAR